MFWSHQLLMGSQGRWGPTIWSRVSIVAVGDLSQLRSGAVGKCLPEAGEGPGGPDSVWTAACLGTGGPASAGTRGTSSVAAAKTASVCGSFPPSASLFPRGGESESSAVDLCILKWQLFSQRAQ